MNKWTRVAGSAGEYTNVDYPGVSIKGRVGSGWNVYRNGQRDGRFEKFAEATAAATRNG